MNNGSKQNDIDGRPAGRRRGAARDRTGRRWRGSEWKQRKEALPNPLSSRCKEECMGLASCVFLHPERRSQCVGQNDLSSPLKCGTAQLMPCIHTSAQTETDDCVSPVLLSTLHIRLATLTHVLRLSICLQATCDVPPAIGLEPEDDVTWRESQRENPMQGTQLHGGQEISILLFPHLS
jgi:hypothetical protein